MSIAFGNRLKKLRKAKKLTQKQVAESIGINQKQYQHWERGRAEPSFVKVQRLAYVFGVSIEWLVFGKEKLIKQDNAISSFLRKIELFLKDNPKALPMMKRTNYLFISSYKKLTEKQIGKHHKVATSRRK
jgi:transcriptional regulator with XRE-family HTH domain